MIKVPNRTRLLQLLLSRAHLILNSLSEPFCSQVPSQCLSQKDSPAKSNFFTIDAPRIADVGVIISYRWRAHLVLFMLIGCAVSCIDLDETRPMQSLAPGLSHPRQTPLPHPIYGVTIDSVEAIDDIVSALRLLSRWPTSRVVFDSFLPPEHYVSALTRIQDVSFVMGEILDSSAMAFYSLEDYRARVSDYVDTLADVVDVWEIGNEVNGAWSGDPTVVAAKISQAFTLVRGRGLRSALTLYYNENCASHSWEEIFNWVETRVNETVRLGLDYVWISYYEEDCRGFRPDWLAVFARLAGLFPTSWIGFGEVGTATEAQKANFLKRYYSLSIDHPAFVGGYFWWYFNSDMVPYDRPLWSVLNTLLAAGPFAVVPRTTTPQQNSPPFDSHPLVAINSSVISTADSQLVNPR